MSESVSRWKVIVLVVVMAAAGIAAVALTRGPSSGVPRQLTIPERDCGLLDHFASLEALKAHLRASPYGWPWMYGDNMAVPATTSYMATYGMIRSAATMATITSWIQ